MIRPVELAANRVTRNYRGGQLLDRFRGLPESDGYAPEDWIGSTTEAADSAAGLSRLPGGATLAAAIAADPTAYLGPDHVAAFGPAPAILVKVLDAAERLMVHCHPTREFAAGRMGLDYGKAECWVVLDSRSTDSCVYLGFASGLDPVELRALVRSQDRSAILGALNRIPVAVGDSIYVPGGVPHAIGPGLLVGEVQEPSDLSVYLEYEAYGLDPELDAYHPGLTADQALDAVDCTAWSSQRRAGLINIERHPGPGRTALLPPAADAHFTVERLLGPLAPRLPQAFSMLVVLDGDGLLRTRDGADRIRRGQTWLVPYGAGEAELSGELTALRCSPPVAR
jgi:mannose-6-phosphate isomerase